MDISLCDFAFVTLLHTLDRQYEIHRKNPTLISLNDEGLVSFVDL